VTLRGRNRERAAPRLFGVKELDLRRTGMARWRGPAACPPLPPTERARRRDENFETMQLLRDWGADLARQFGLRYKSVDAEQEGVFEHYGICYEDGTIRIRLRHAKTGRLLKRSSLVDTLCHELAHLRYLDHSIRFRRLYRRILDCARKMGLYTPGPEVRPQPTQLDLFAGACGTISHARRRGVNR